jgi:ribosomal protein S14
MKKRLKVENTQNKIHDNFKTIIQKYASNYLIRFLSEFYAKQRFFFTLNDLDTYQELPIIKFLCFVVRHQIIAGITWVERGRAKICSLTARARALISRVGLARTALREVMNTGLLLAQRKSSF